jgi:hypothetical protein
VKSERVFSVLCPHCGTLGEFHGEFHAEIVVLCGHCKEDITRDFKRAYYRDVAADINARFVERENRAFFEYLASCWPGEDGPRRKD